MLWWAQLPDLLPPARAGPASLTGKKTAPAPLASKAIEERLEDASEQAEEAGFRLGKKKEPVAESPRNVKKELWQSEPGV